MYQRDATRCTSNPCRNWTTDSSGLCHQHRHATAASAPPAPAATRGTAAAAAAPPLSGGGRGNALAGGGAGTGTKTAGTGTSTVSDRNWLLNGNANDAVLPPDQVDLARLEHLRGRNIITVDLDGTIYGRELCHPLPRNHPSAFDADHDCDHTRNDIIDQIRTQAAEHDALPVILSWRALKHPESQRWLDHIGFKQHALLIPGAPQDCAALNLPYKTDGTMDHQANRERHGGSQAAFKAATVETLQTQLGCTVVGSWDDNPKVIRELATAGVHHPQLVEVPGRDRACDQCKQPFDPVNVQPSPTDPTLCGDCHWPPTSTQPGEWPTRPNWMPSPAPPRDPLAGITRPGWMPNDTHTTARAEAPF